MTEENKHATSSSVEFIEQMVERETNHLVREHEELEGKVSISVKADGSFNIKLFKGTEDKARSIENVDKETLLELMEDQL